MDHAARPRTGLLCLGHCPGSRGYLSGIIIYMEWTELLAPGQDCSVQDSVRVVDDICQVLFKQGWALRSFPFRTLRSFAF